MGDSEKNVCGIHFTFPSNLLWKFNQLLPFYWEKNVTFKMVVMCEDKVQPCW